MAYCLEHVLLTVNMPKNKCKCMLVQHIVAWHEVCITALYHHTSQCPQQEFGARNKPIRCGPHPIR